MKITIDTKEDSPHEIRKVIQLLTNLANHQQTQPRNIFESNNSMTDSWGEPIEQYSQPSNQHQNQIPSQYPTQSSPLQSVPSQSAPTGFMNMFGDVQPVKETNEPEKKQSSGWDDNEEPPGLMTY